MGSLSRALSLSLSLSLSRRQGLPRDLLKICFTRSLSREARRYMRTRGKIGQKKKNLSTSTSSFNGDEKKSFPEYIPLFRENSLLLCMCMCAYLCLIYTPADLSY